MNNVINICIYFLPNENKCKTTTTTDFIREDSPLDEIKCNVINFGLVFKTQLLRDLPYVLNL